MQVMQVTLGLKQDAQDAHYLKKMLITVLKENELTSFLSILSFISLARVKNAC